MKTEVAHNIELEMLKTETHLEEMNRKWKKKSRMLATQKLDK